MRLVRRVPNINLSIYTRLRGCSISHYHTLPELGQRLATRGWKLGESFLIDGIHIGVVCYAVEVSDRSACLPSPKRCRPFGNL